MRSRLLSYLIVLTIFSTFLTGCSQQPEAVEPTHAEPTTAAVPQVSDIETLRIALIPVLDVLPFFIAQEQGYFTEENLNVVFVPVSSALEREQLLVAGEVDGMLTDVIGPAITNAAAEPSVRIVAVARRAFDDAPLFRILAAPDTGFSTPADLAGVPIGISENSVIQYLGDRLMAHAGVPAESVIFESVPSIPTRYSLMMEGQLQAAILPDPLATAAIEAGAVQIADDTVFVNEGLSQSVLSFSNDALNTKPAAVEKFLRAWNRAVEALNANPDAYRQLWLDNTSVPESVQATYSIPSFPLREITDRAVWDDVNAWLVSRGIIDTPAAYEDSVDSSFLSE